MKAVQMSNDIFTLTLTLARWERANCPQTPTISGDSSRFDDFTTRRTARWLFPLPAVEAQGECECLNQAPAQVPL